MLTKSILLVLFVGLPRYLHAQTAAEILGKWKDTKHPEKQVIMLQQSSGVFYGRTIPQDGDVAKEATVIFSKLIWDEKSRSYSGILIDPATRKEFPVTVKLKNRSTFTFEVKALFFKRPFEFSKIE